jgi:hypothetical protein
MKTKLIELATSKQIGFTSQMFTDTNWKHSLKEDLRYYLWMCELQKWCREKCNKHVTIFSTPHEKTSTYYPLFNYEIIDSLDSKLEPLWKLETYEKALEHGLYKTLLLIQEENGKEN